MNGKVLVLGAGYAGLSAFLELKERVRDGALTLVNQTPYHTFTTELHILAAGEDDSDDVTLPLRRVVRPPARFQQGRVTALRPDEGKVDLAGGTSLEYDLLIVALGSVPEYFGVPGAKEYGLPLYDLRSAQRLQTRLAELPEGSRVAVAGAGLTGAELAAEIADRYGRRFHVLLVEGADRILPGLDPDLGAAASRVLEREGVEILTGHLITGVGPDHLRLEPGGERRVDLLVWAAGVRGNPLLAESGFEVDRRGRGLVDAYLRSTRWNNVYLAGDCAAALHPETGETLPPTGQIAVQAGRQAARNLAARLQGAPEAPFEPRIKGFFASLGPRRGIGEVGGWRVEGATALWVKRLIEAHHAFEAGGLGSLLSRVLRQANRQVLVRHRRSRPEGGTAD